MSTIEVVNHMTLDGVMQAPAGADEDRRGGFEHGGWAVPYQDEVQGEYMGARMSSRGDGALLLGRWTYEKMRSAWTQQPEDNMIRQVLEQSTKYVASRSDRPVEWQNSELLHGDAVETVAALKAREDRNLVILGSAELIHALLPHGLIDALLLTIHPLVLGSGKRLFPDSGALAEFTLTESKPTTTGVLITRYERARTSVLRPAASDSSPS
jgi:dihydrofolate reductase